MNENAAAPPAQNPGGVLFEELNPIPHPMTNNNDSIETQPTLAPSPGSDEETTSNGQPLNDNPARKR